MKRKEVINSIKATFPAISQNEAICRSMAAIFTSQCNPTIEELADIKTIISEAVTNCIVHAYKNVPKEDKRYIYITAQLYRDNTLKFTIKDNGCGIADINMAMQPLYTTDAENERSGMGLPIMQSFSDTFKIKSKLGKGTTIIFTKKISQVNEY